MFKKLFLLLTILAISTSAFAFDVPKNEDYYKSQIQNQRFLYNETGIVGAIQKGNTEVVEYFMLAGFNPNATYVATPLAFYAVKHRNMSALESLLKHGADPNISSMDLNLLTWAIRYKSSDSVALLIKYNVDIDKKFNGRTPLNYAIQTKQTKIVELLLKAGAKPDEKTKKLINKSKDEYLKDLFADYKW